MINFNSVKKILRYQNWWNFVVPPLFSFIYLAIYLKEIEFYDSAELLGLIFVCIVGTAGFGYFLNDVSDIKFDEIAGKNNFASKLSVRSRALIIFLLLIIAFIPWYFLPVSYINFGLFLLQLLLLTIYSVKPIRLKNNIYLGVFADALYSGTIFILVIISTFHLLNVKRLPDYSLFFFTILAWAFFKGLRNILLHQLNDRKNDKKSGFITFAINYKPVRTLYLINYVILPIELVLFTLLIIIISIKIKLYFVWFIAFILFTLIKFSFWKIPKLPYRQRLFKFLYFMNDFYEEWMPVITLVYLSVRNIYFIIFLLLHIIIFSRGVKKFCIDLKYFVNK